MQRGLVIALLAVLWVVGLALLADATRATWTARAEVASPQFVRIYPAVYLGVLTLLWIAALPEYFGATDGVTSRGTPIGSGWYAAACIVVSAWFVITSTRATLPARAGTASEQRGTVAV